MNKEIKVYGKEEDDKVLVLQGFKQGRAEREKEILKIIDKLSFECSTPQVEILDELKKQLMEDTKTK